MSEATHLPRIFLSTNVRCEFRIELIVIRLACTVIAFWTKSAVLFKALWPISFATSRVVGWKLVPCLSVIPWKLFVKWVGWCVRWNSESFFIMWIHDLVEYAIAIWMGTFMNSTRIGQFDLKQLHQVSSGSEDRSMWPVAYCSGICNHKLNLLKSPWAKWPPLRRRYIRMHFCEYKVLYFV